MTMPSGITIEPTDSRPTMPTDLGFALARVLRKTSEVTSLRWRIEWMGSKIPRGVEIFSHSIQWAQHGRLSDSEGEVFAFYSREETFSGRNKDRHSMIVWRALS